MNRFKKRILIAGGIGALGIGLAGGEYEVTEPRAKSVAERPSVDVIAPTVRRSVREADRAEDAPNEQTLAAIERQVELIGAAYVAGQVMVAPGAEATLSSLAREHGGACCVRSAPVATAPWLSLRG